MPTPYGLLTAVCVVSTTICTALVVLRIISRVLTHAVGADDYTAIVALVSIYTARSRKYLRARAVVGQG